MSKVAILGAGAMGSALATPCIARGHEVALWGTHLDDVFLADYASGAPHPGTKVPMPVGVEVFDSARIGEALHGTDVAIVAVASVGVLDVSALAAPHLDSQALMLVSKGFHERADGTIGLMPEAVRQALGDPSATIVAVGGPCKANEVAAGRLTVTAYAARDGESAARMGELLSTDDYHVAASDDEIGLEVAAPLKNVFAIALGVADGLEVATGEPWHNLKSAIFARAVHEMRIVAESLGGRAETVYGLPGVGDLEVTGLSGRNKVYGARLGAGEDAAEALEAMRLVGHTVEGVPATALAMRLAAQLGGDVRAELRLLAAIDAVLHGAPARETMSGAL